MDVYHIVLVKLLEVTEGKDSKSVDFKDLVRKLSFHGNYTDIFEHLSGEGWVAEDRKADYLRITHWGIAEAKKALNAESGDVAEIAVSVIASKVAATAREFAGLLESFAKAASNDNLKKAESKFAELESVFNLAKKDAR